MRVAMTRVMIMTTPVFVFVFVRVAADFHVATAPTAAACLAHKSKIKFIPTRQRRGPVRVPAAIRRWDYGTGDIR
jgi:hypothetical protein